MPWLAATAFLHSVMIQERKGMLKVWNMVLVALAFELSVFGTFLTRSGVVNSIHSFAKSSIGAWFLAFVVISTLFSLALILWRLPLLKARTKLESALSREAAFLYNNLLLVALCLTILWGVLFPILTQLVKGETRTIGTAVLRLLPARLRAAAAAADGHRPADRLAEDERPRARADARAGRSASRSPCGVALVVAGAGSSKPGLIAYTFSAFVLTTIVVELVRGTRVDRLAVHAGRRATGAATAATSSTPRSCCSRSGSPARAPTAAPKEVRLTPGQSTSIGGYTLTLRGVRRTPTPNAIETRAVFDVSGRWHGTLTSGDNQYFIPPEPSREVGIKTSWLRAEDLYVIVDDVEPEDERRLREGARETARQPDLDRRHRVPVRGRRRAVARRARAAAARRAARPRA